MPAGIPFVISAPSGAGKSTLVGDLRAGVEGLAFSVSHTTRPPRQGDREGVDYHFVERGAFEQMMREGAFAEWAEVHGNLYGTSLRALREQLSAGTDVVLDIDVQGALQIASTVPQTVLVFILPPSWQELRRRLESRGLDPTEVIEKRLKNAREELDRAHRYHYLVVNDDRERAVRELCCIVRAERSRTSLRSEALERLLEAGN
jgi:guanylate kinase